MHRSLVQGEGKEKLSNFGIQSDVRVRLTMLSPWGKPTKGQNLQQSCQNFRKI